MKRFQTTMFAVLTACGSSGGSRVDNDSGTEGIDGSTQLVDAAVVLDDATQSGSDAPMMPDAPPTACTPGTWVVEVIDATGDVGSHNAVAIDATGRLHVAYWDKTNGDLKYALRTATGTWSKSTVDTANNVGGSLAIAVDAAGNPHIAYLDQTSYDLKYATRVGAGQWSIALVEAAGEVGLSPSIAIDAAGTVHVAYLGLVSGVASTLRYASKPAGGTFTPGHVTNTNGLSTALAVNGAGVHITFVVGIAPNQELATISQASAGAAWSSDVDINTPRPGAFAMASGTTMHLSYHQASTPILGYAVRSAPGTWTLSDVDTMDMTGGTNSLALDAIGGVHIAYAALPFASASFRLRYAHKPAAGAWSKTPIIAAGSIGDDVSLAVAPSGAPHVIIYGDLQQRDLKYAHPCE